MEGFIKYLQAKRTKQITLLLEKGKRIPFNRMVPLYLGCIIHLFYEAKKYYNDYDNPQFSV